MILLSGIPLSPPIRVQRKELTLFWSCILVAILQHIPDSLSEGARAIPIQHLRRYIQSVLPALSQSSLIEPQNTPLNIQSFYNSAGTVDTCNAGGYAPAPTERPHTIHTWIQHLLMERIQDGGLKVASALQARMHSVLSAAMLAYEQCKCATSRHGWALALNCWGSHQENR